MQLIAPRVLSLFVLIRISLSLSSLAFGAYSIS